MIRRRADVIARAAAILSLAVGAHAQSTVPATLPPLVTGEKPATTLPDAGRGSGEPGKVRLFGNLFGVDGVLEDRAPVTTSFGSTWSLKRGIRYEAPGGVELSASVILRRGYSLPITMAQPLGSDTMVVDHRNSSAEFGWAPMHWDTELRVRKALTTMGRVDVAVVGEAFNLFNVNPRSEARPRGGILTTRTFRVGTILGF